MIELTDLAKVYRMGAVDVHALRGVSLQIARGQWVAIMGPSGSGKSTLMHIIGCLDTPTSGSYRLGGREVASLSQDQLATVRNAEIGFVFQSFNLLPRMSALQQVMLPLRYGRGDASLAADERERRARAALAMVGLDDRVGHRPSELSGGEQQRVTIARALVGGPSIILADEPTGNLDSKSGAEVMAILQQLHQSRQMTVVMVTHDADIGAQAERIVHLMDGRIVDGAE